MKSSRPVFIAVAFGALASATARADELQATIHREMSVRDTFVGCGSIWALGDHDTVRDALVAESKVELPPAAGMRAAGCLIEASPADPLALGVVKGWMADPAVPGFALLVVDKLDLYDEPVAIELGELAVTRAATDARFARYAPRHLDESRYPSVRALAGQIRSR